MRSLCGFGDGDNRLGMLDTGQRRLHGKTATEGHKQCHPHHTWNSLPQLQYTYFIVNMIYIVEILAQKLFIDLCVSVVIVFLVK
jgi:hypothetical protein